jgi:multiple sugar transport system substrate-binding protein
MRSLVALAGAAALTAGLTACGGGDGGGGGSGGGGKTLHMLIGANTQYPAEFAAWQKSISDKF